MSWRLRFAVNYGLFMGMIGQGEGVYIAGVIYMILALLNKSPTDLPSMI